MPKANLVSSLSSITHKNNYCDVIAVIKFISVTLRRKKLIVTLDIADDTMNDPAFTIKLDLDSETLNQFINVGKKDLIIHLISLKIIKSDGMVYGEVCDKDELKLLDDDGSYIPWCSDQKQSTVSSKIKERVQLLKTWMRSLSKSEINSNERNRKLSKTQDKLQNMDSTNKIRLTRTTSESSLLSTKPSSNSKKLGEIKNLTASTSDKKSVFYDDQKLQKINKSTEVGKLNSSKKFSESKKESCGLEKMNESLGKVSDSSKVLKRNTSESDLKLKATIFGNSFNNAQSRTDFDKNTGQKKSRFQNLDKNKSKSLENIAHFSSAISKKRLSVQKINENCKTGKLNSPRSSNLSKLTVKDNEPSVKDVNMDKNAKGTLTRKRNHKNERTTFDMSDDSNIQSSLKRMRSSPLVFLNTSESSLSCISKEDMTYSDTITINNVSPLKTSTAKTKLLGLDGPITGIKGKELAQQGNEKINNLSNKSDDLEEENLEEKNTKRKLFMKSTKIKRHEDTSFGNKEKSKAMFLKNVNSNKSTKEETQEDVIITSISKENDCSIQKDKNKKVVEQTDVFDKDIAKSSKTSKTSEPITIKSTTSDQTSSKQNKLKIELNVNKERKSKRFLSSSISMEENKKTRRQTEDKTPTDSHKSDPVIRCLNPFCKVNDIKNARKKFSYSEETIEEIEVPETFDLCCKIVSQFLCIENDIQVLRVQDGSICSAEILVVPESSTWNGVIEQIERNPQVEKKLPFIDIIIFNWSRLGANFVPNRFFKLMNLMAAHFQLKCRSTNSKKALFIFGEGQNMYPRLLNVQKKKDIEESIKEENYLIAWKNTLEKGIIKHTNILTHSSTETENGNKTSPKMKTTLIDTEKKGFEGVPQSKPNLENNPLESEDGSSKVLEEIKEVSTNKSQSNEDLNQIFKADQKKKSQITGNDHECHVNRSPISLTDDFPLDDTPLALRELREILQEESDLGLPQTQTEDVHLKNSGTEITYSQFCNAADSKSKIFRTSTQDETTSEIPNICSLNIKKPALPREESEMESLVYYPSSSSNDSSCQIVSLVKKGSTTIKAKSSTSEGHILNEIKVQTSVIKQTSEVANSENSVHSNSPSINLLSSNSSDLDSKKNDCYLKEKEKSEFKQIKSDSNTDVHPKNVEHELEIGEIEVLSDNTSSDGFSVDDDLNLNYRSEQSSKGLLLISQNKKVEDSIVPFDLKNNGPKSFQFFQNVDDSCFFKSTSKRPTLSEDDINSIYNEENQPVKFYSYSFDRKLPFLTYNEIMRLKNTNFLTVAVTLVSISPPIEGNAFQEQGIKSLCRICGNLYSAYNSCSDASSPTAAVAVGHQVCPNSMCCNQTLENPEYVFSVQLKLADGTNLPALLGGKHAENIFGHSAQQVINEKMVFPKVTETINKLQKAVSTAQLIKVDLTRVNICDPTSGSLYIKKIHF